MNRIRALRKQKNWTVKRLAEISGVPYKPVWRIDRGDNPKLQNAYKVASAFQLTVYELWGIAPTGKSGQEAESKILSMRELREKRGWSFDRLRNLSSVKKNTLYRVENGQEPSLESAVRIAAAFGVSVYQMWKPEIGSQTTASH
jgi:transcriptional regulator with XRE-family HTH domain